MKITIEYFDDESLTVEEVVSRATRNYGPRAKVKIDPDSSIAYDHITLGLQMLITHKQVSLYHDPDHNYTHAVLKLRAETLKTLEELVDQVISDNERRIR